MALFPVDDPDTGETIELLEPDAIRSFRLSIFKLELQGSDEQVTDSSVSEQLKRAMRSLAQSVVVITTAAGGTRHAMSATSVTSVSLDPPSMLFCMNRTASSHPTLAAGAGFCINLLGMHHEPLARLCSGSAKGEARFAEGVWEHDEDGIPYLSDAQASISLHSGRADELRHP